ncbi:Hvo_1808 family surface protein [Natronomonas sp.]|uniref:Hvo_1808 family surface protein n=1 Tax=Natronomonas sp. TaxID=2184060 RepID=UPI002FC34B6B
MNRRPMAAIALAVLLALAGCSAGYQPSSAEPATAEDAESHEIDHLGYYDGYWHNDTLDINASDGLTEAETEAVLSRAMARVQLLRGLEFEEDIEVELQTRAEFREESDDVWTEPGEGTRRLDNAQFEALFLVGPDEDVVDVRSGNRGGSVLGFYVPGTGRLVLVSGRDPATLNNEYTLAHELVHALQDQRFGLESLGPATLDSVNARNGLIEGEAMSVQHDYEDRCESGEWQCVGTGGGSGASTGSEFHWGVYFAGFFPYAEGPSFIAHHRERGGWDAIDAMHGDQPTDAAEVIYPSTYDTDAYGNATVTDRSDADWERVRTEDGPDYAEVGQSGLTSMFAYTLYAESAEAGSGAVIAQDEFLNSGENGLDRQRPFTYDVSYAEGWRADRLQAYVDDNRTAFVWNVTFNDRANASEFGDGYEQVFEFWGGQRVETHGDAEVWRFGENERFRGAVWIHRDGTSFTVVKAPDRAELDDVYAPAGAVEAAG